MLLHTYLSNWCSVVPACAQRRPHALQDKHKQVNEEVLAGTPDAVLDEETPVEQAPQVRMNPMM
jgi:hypothetical protein